MPTAFIPRETLPGETRVAASPDSVRRLAKEGLAVLIEAGAGAGSGISDAAFEAAGATLTADPDAAWGKADVVLALHPPTPANAARMKEGAALIGFIHAYRQLDLVARLRDGRVTAFAMDAIPRLSRAQKMDALSSQANIAGYKAVIMAADALPKLFPLLMTAAGTIKPAHVVILGAGVAGLQAIATAKRLGAAVEAADVRPAVKEEVESLGARFIAPPEETVTEDKDGYAGEQSEEYLARQRALVRERIVRADVVITTAAIPGKPAPRLVTADMVREMRDGAVIVDLAIETGGNCELSEPDKVAVKEGVTIIARANVPALVPVHATEMYARNVLNVVLDLLKDGEINFDLEDELVRGALITHKGEILHAPTQSALQSGGNAS
ncbi:MAG: Re/Si-specific NAD(P)(+) transhydrogenase subunit alpha [Myxococcota bacterium]